MLIRALAFSAIFAFVTLAFGADDPALSKMLEDYVAWRMAPTKGTGTVLGFPLYYDGEIPVENLETLIAREEQPSKKLSRYTWVTKACESVDISDAKAFEAFLAKNRGKLGIDHDRVRDPEKLKLFGATHLLLLDVDLNRKQSGRVESGSFWVLVKHTKERYLVVGYQVS